MNFFFSFFALLFVLPLFAAESTVVRIGARTEVVSAPKYGIDLGVIDQHRKVDCSFTVTNRNWRERKVLGVRGNCACLETDVEEKTLARGETCPVKVLFNPAGMEGPVEKLVTLRLEGKEIEYPIKANVRLRLGFRPADAAFGIVEASTRGVVPPIQCRLAGYVAASTTAELLPPPKPFFDVRFEKGVLTAAFREETLYPGHYSEIWQIRTSDPELPLLKFPVSALVSGGLGVNPRVLDLPREGPVCSRQVLLRPVSRSAGFTVRSAVTKPRRWGDVKLVKRPLNGWMIRIENIDPVSVRQFSKKPYLEVVTDFPGMEKLEIPLAVEQFAEPKR